MKGKGCESDMTSRKIAVIVAGFDQIYQREILNGIESAAPGWQLDFAVFACFSGTLGNASHDSGEYKIFDLPDFSTFDGAILLTNTIDNKKVVDDIHSRIISAGIPAVSIDDDVEEMLHIGIDNKTAMRKITEHFIKVHGFTKFNYISGPEQNPESADRLNAFLEVLEENGLSIDPKRIYYGDFRAPSGTAAIEYFLRNNDHMPEAVICANDVMAASAVNRLFEAGYKIPEEIAVSGFDNIYNNHNFRIELTSVERPLFYSGQLACKMLHNVFSGTEQERSVILDMSTNFTESCGCCGSVISDISEYKQLNVANYNKVERMINYSTTFNKLSCELQGCGTSDEYFDSLKNFVKEMDPEEFYFCLCYNWNSDKIDELTISQKREIPTDYTSDMYVPIAYCKGEFHDEIRTIPAKTLFPHINFDEVPGKFYYMLPLHFGERCLGYMVICNCKMPIHNSMFQSWCITINNSLENIRKIITLEYAVKRLGKLYTQDAFSGIFNRIGFAQSTDEIYRECMKQRRNIMLMFIDLDGLKIINDTYGHSVGDVAIRSIAEVLRSTCKNGEIFCRFGGDEFIVFAADFNENMAADLTSRLQDNINYLNEHMDNPFTLSVSIGYIIAVPDEGEDLFRFVTEADKVMYEQKRRKKHSNYLKSE